MEDELKVTKASLESANTDVEGCAQLAISAKADTESTALGASVSRMSGLDQLGAAHGQVINGTIGSALQAAIGFTEQFTWVEDMLQKTGWAAGHHNNVLTRMLDQDGEHINPSEQKYTFPARPTHDTHDFPFHTPLVLRNTTLAAVEADLASTNTAQIADAAMTWQDVATSSEEWAGILEGTANQLASENTGDWVDEATNRMTELANLSRTYAANATAMATTVSYMGQIPGTYLPQVATARQAIEKITDPAARVAAEQTYLAAFYGAYEADIHNAVPTFRNLLVPAADQGGKDSSAQMGMSGPAAASGLGAATELAQSSPGQGASALNNLPAAGSAPATHTAHTPVAPVAGMPAGGVGAAGGVPGAVNGAAALARLGVQPPVPVAHGGAWGGHTSPHTGGRFGTPGGWGTPGFSGTGVGGGTGSGANAPSSTGGAHSPGAGGPLFGRPGTGAGAGAGIGRQDGSGPSRGSLRSDGFPGPGGIHRYGGSGSGSGAGSLGVGSPGGGSSSGALGGSGARGAVGVDGSSQGYGARGGSGGGAAPHAAGGRSGGTGMGGVPMGGAPLGAGGDRPRGKAKAVTTKVEYSRNLKALLGEPRAYVPGVLGAWVRNPE